MKGLHREFTTKEKIIIVAMSIFLIGLFYYYFVHQSVTSQTRQAESNISSLTATNNAMSMQLAHLSEVEASLDAIKGQSESVSYLPTYNNFNNLMEYLNNILCRTNSFNMQFSNAVAEGDLVRRSVAITFEASDYDKAVEIIGKLVNSEYRCIVFDIKMSSVKGVLSYSRVSVSCKATFYETLVGGFADEGLTGN
ncbi:MAG: type II secretion system protein GspM [Clostridiales bacterium]|nr:type II secretion system protein GspM [Clostridiales bacterium]